MECPITTPTRTGSSHATATTLIPAITSRRRNRPRAPLPGVASLLSRAIVVLFLSQPRAASSATLLHRHLHCTVLPHPNRVSPVTPPLQTVPHSHGSRRHGGRRQKG